MFVCEVGGEDTTVRVDAGEHSVGRWVDEVEAGRLDMSGGMRRVVEDAFGWRDGVGERGGLEGLRG